MTLPWQVTLFMAVCVAIFMAMAWIGCRAWPEIIQTGTRQEQLVHFTLSMLFIGLYAWGGWLLLLVWFGK